MANYIYECPVCNNLIMLAIDSESCPFQRSLVGQCDKCNNKVEILEDSYKEWLKEKEKEVKQDYPEGDE
uniref:Uncharacterized protein n=1 Tax=viral metagenome TaxID=1070528 RepID=A0A6H1ZNG0_9ZZZZ